MKNADPPAGLDVSPEFIEESRNADLVKVRQKNAPYTRSERRKRRTEVAKLHFEHGMPAVRISQLMGVDRNTVNADLKLLYSEAMKDYADSDMQFGDYVEKQLVRLEKQRDRLGLYLADAKGDIISKISIERLIADNGAMLKIPKGINEMTFVDHVCKIEEG